MMLWALLQDTAAPLLDTLHSWMMLVLPLLMQHVDMSKIDMLVAYALAATVYIKLTSCLCCQLHPGFESATS